MNLPGYESPPLIEVVMGCSFSPLEDLTILHLGQYWTEIQDEYPGCEQMPPIGQARPIGKHFPVPSPRMWFVSEDESRLIQVQNGYFITNWRRQGDQPYPRYEKLIDKFWDTFEGFRSFIDSYGLGELQIQDCELTYINDIPCNRLIESREDLSNVLPDFGWRSADTRFLKHPVLDLCKLHFDLPDKCGTLRVELKRTQSCADESPSFRLHLGTKGLGQKKDSDSMKTWFDLSHERIVEAFADLTTEEAQVELWGKQTDSLTD